MREAVVSLISKIITGYLLLILLLSFSACAGQTAASNVQARGKEVSAKTVLLETEAILLQQKPPIDALNMYLEHVFGWISLLQRPHPSAVEAHAGLVDGRDRRFRFRVKTSAKKEMTLPPRRLRLALMPGNRGILGNSHSRLFNLIQ